MRPKSVGLFLLWWVEIIVSIRVLLFTIPVLMSKTMAQALSAKNLDDWFLIVISFTAFIYFLVGIASVLGHKWWKFFHYLATFFTILLTFGLIRPMVKSASVVDPKYFLPVACSFVILIGIMVFHPRTKE